ncbi:lipoprotein, putative [Xanthomonas oryzae pv. oryzicola BLS256]|uniref:Lipoprotein, putative n=1 Tax=Xanthomonas oryzae pv. oryzicola (strain BLS256) TaxID=383407 RepID=G7TIT4_XANOB|nr:lipoprotein, putative [Xanthomonas oryzae pv. oryzicola BLS256]QEO99858.1 lipoprotein, putative [Xanthomonas oryzae pv. oryzicola]
MVRKVFLRASLLMLAPSSISCLRHRSGAAGITPVGQSLSNWHCTQ